MSYHFLWIEMEPAVFFAALFLFLLVLIRIGFSVFPGGIVKAKSKMAPMGYTLFYTDEKGTEQKQNVIYNKMLVSEKYQLQGKPDFVFINRRETRLLPVELKSGSIGKGEQPKPGDLMQLAAYFLILEDLYGIRPREGRLIYKDCMFKVPNTKGLRKKLFATLDEMQAMLETGEGRAIPSFQLCRYCVCRGTVCEFCQDERYEFD